MHYIVLRCQRPKAKQKCHLKLMAVRFDKKTATCNVEPSFKNNPQAINFISINKYAS